MARKRNRNTKPHQTHDGFQNLRARVGAGAGSQHDSTRYSINQLSQNKRLLDSLYRDSWVAGVGVDAIADDMTRKGITITSNLEAGEEIKLDGTFDGLKIWNSLSDVIKWSRLYGGAIAVMMIEGQDLSTALRVDTVGKGAFKGLVVLDKWMLDISSTEKITDKTTDLGKPKFYRVTENIAGLQGEDIHHSRVIRLDGIGLPYQASLTENGWGISVIERVLERLTLFDSAIVGAGQLVYKAHLRTYSVDNLRGILVMGGAALKGLLEQIGTIRQFQSNEGITLMDTKDKFETHSYSFAGLSDLQEQFAQQLSGGFQIPLVRFFGQSPSGFNSGESDLSSYYDVINSLQERRLRSHIKTLLNVTYMSLFGKMPLEDISFDFNSLWQMSDLDRSTVCVNITNAIVSLFESGIISKKTALTEVKQSAHLTGIGSNISDEEINDAETDSPPAENFEIDSSERQSENSGQLRAPTTADSAYNKPDNWFLRWFK